ncbi:hypothetical protein HR060_16430 [Catenovulum sp. SM1970]|uniref:hypothetical protein n=1 Tax=Marinifaba aquimaris TaxID=2741323 RepID=UPI001571C145|nr:hypothetical protein [Marinifaba aquimaris]NTS78437.1 hypothetical protein [Marinifaba aquimaris]
MKLLYRLMSHKQPVFFVVLSLFLQACTSTQQANDEQQAEFNYQQQVQKVYAVRDGQAALSQEQWQQTINDLRYAYAMTLREEKLLKYLFENEQNLFELVDLGQHQACYEMANQALSISYINLSAHFAAMLCAQNLGLSNQHTFHSNMVDSIMRSLGQQRNGRSPETAFVAYCYDDLHAFTLLMELQVKSRQYILHKDVVYDQLKVVEAATGDEFDLYFDISNLMAL